MLKRNVALAGIIASALAAPGAGFAQTAPAGESKPPQIWGFDFTGYVDMGYTNFTTGSGKFNALNGAPPGTNALPTRVYDYKQGLSLQNLNLMLANQPENGFGGVLDLTIGRDADVIASYGTINKDNGPVNGANHYIDPTQAFVQYGAGRLTVIAGKFATLAGAEVIKARDNSNFSRSILFGYAIPFTHTGLRATYKASDTVSLTGGVNRGWDAVQSPHSGAGLELGTTINFSKAFTLAGMVHSGTEKLINYPAGGQVALAAVPEGTRTLLDLIATFNATDKLTFIVNYDNASQSNAAGFTTTGAGTAHWEGWAAYANYTINNDWRISVRGEWFNDKDGYRTTTQAGATTGQIWKEATFTVGYNATKALELRGELRRDGSNQNVFYTGTGALGAPASGRNAQSSLGLQAIYKF